MFGLKSDCHESDLFSLAFVFDAGRADSPLHAAWRFVINGGHGVMRPTWAASPAWSSICGRQNL
jgi:hypothetical protein